MKLEVLDIVSEGRDGALVLHYLLLGVIIELFDDVEVVLIFEHLLLELAVCQVLRNVVALVKLMIGF